MRDAEGPRPRGVHAHSPPAGAVATCGSSHPGGKAAGAAPSWVDIVVSPGSHSSEAAVNKQLNDESASPPRWRTPTCSRRWTCVSAARRRSRPNGDARWFRLRFDKGRWGKMRDFGQKLSRLHSTTSARVVRPFARRHTRSIALLRLRVRSPDVEAEKTSLRRDIKAAPRPETAGTPGKTFGICSSSTRRFPHTTTSTPPPGVGWRSRDAVAHVIGAAGRRGGLQDLPLGATLPTATHSRSSSMAS